MAAKKTATNATHTDEAASSEAVLRVYELGYHILPTVQEGDLEGVVGAFRSAIEKAAGSFIAESAPVLTRLAYPMRKRQGEKYSEYDRTHFGWIKFEGPASLSHTLDELLKRDPLVLRHIIFTTIREETRAQTKIPALREVKRGDIIKAAPRAAETDARPVSDVELDKALEVLTTE